MRPEQERVKNLLLDTVTLLCRNGLTYRCELKIQGLLGITLDNDEVFVVHINEKISDNIEIINDTNEADVDPATTVNETGTESFADLILTSSEVQTKSGAVQNLDNETNVDILQDFEDITPGSAAPEGDFDVPIVITVPKFEQKSVAEKPLTHISSNGNAEAIAKQMLLQHDDLLRINTTETAARSEATTCSESAARLETAVGSEVAARLDVAARAEAAAALRPLYINQLSSPAKLGTTNGVVGDLSIVAQAMNELRSNKRLHNSTTRDQDGILRTMNSDEDDDDDSSADESFSSKRRRSLPSITYPTHATDPSGSLVDAPESKPYISDFTPGIINPWQSVGGGIATGIGGRTYNGDNGGETFGGISLSSNMFAGDLSGMLSAVAGSGSSFLTNEQIMTKQREFYLTRNNHHSANSRLPRRPRESEEKHFGCPFCGLSYYYKKHLKFHLKQKHGL